MGAMALISTTLSLSPLKLMIYTQRWNDPCNRLSSQILICS